MPYATGRIFHDADAHIMELPGFLRDNAAKAFAGRMPLLGVSAIGDDPSTRIDWAQKTATLHGDPVYRANEAELLQRKNYYAVGAFERDHRAQALDQLGFASQLMFNTWTSGFLAAAEQANDVDLAYAMADAHNRGMIDFCSPDRRLLPVAYVCLMDQHGRTDGPTYSEAGTVVGPDGSCDCVRPVQPGPRIRTHSQA